MAAPGPGRRCRTCCATPPTRAAAPTEEHEANVARLALNAEGYRPPKRTAVFTGQQVRSIIDKHAIRERAKGRPAVLMDLNPGEWSVPGLSAEPGMPTASIYNWIYRGWITARRGPGGRNWIILADEQQLGELRERRNHPPGYCTRARWAPAQPETGNHEKKDREDSHERQIPLDR